MTVTFLARHGETASNLAGRYAGHSPEPLTPLGREQVSRLAKRLSEHGICEIWTSEVARAQESADILASALGVAVRADARLNEMRMGPWEGLTEQEVAARFPGEYGTWLLNPDRLRLAGRETLDALAARVMGAVSEAAEVRRSVLLVTHVAPIRVAALRTLDVPLECYKRVPVGNADCLVREEAGPDVRRLGETRSLRHEIGNGALRRRDG